MMKYQIDNNKESGNALWFILVAVALMAALTSVVTRTSDTAEESGSFERYRVEASDIMRFAGSVKQAVNQLQMRGISEVEISFDNSFISSSLYANANCADSACLVFDKDGGGLNYKQPSANWHDVAFDTQTTYRTWEFSGNNHVDGIETDIPELIMYLGYLNRGLCRQINDMLDIPEILGDVPEDTDGIETLGFDGSFEDNIVSPDYGVINNMTGRRQGCFLNSNREYTFYHVLIER